jgi:lipoprotein NlpI
VTSRMFAVGLILSFAFGAGCNNADADARADAVRARGLVQMNAGNFDLAIAQFDSAIRMNPKNADAYNSRGNAYASKGDHDRAIASFDSAIGLRPAYAFAFRNRGVSYAAKSDLDRAIQDFDRAIALDPAYAGALNSRGFARQMTGDHERALQDYDRSIELAPESQVAYRNRANVRFILGRFDEAASDLERSVKFVEAATPAPARFNETGGYAVVWLHVARMRAGQDDASEFAANSARIDSTYWPRPVVSFFEGKLTADQLVAQTASVADSKLRNDQRCGAEFFAGQAAIWRKQPSEARKRLETMTRTCSKRFIEHAVAEADLARLGAAAR